MPASATQPLAVLFACGLNSVRSPIAAGLFSQLFGRAIYVGSAGVRKGDGGGHEVLVLVALPGVNLDHVEAVLDDGDLVVVGTRTLPNELRTAIIHRLELPQGRFERQVPLPPGRYEKPRSAVANGCLVIKLPKVAPQRRRP